VSSGDGSLYAFGDDGDKRWDVDLEPTSAPVIAGDRVFVGSDDRSLHALDARTGDTAWTFRTGAPVVAAPTVDAALVYVGGQDGVVYAIDARTGAERWRFRGAAGEEFSSPVVAAGVVYAVGGTGRIYALDAATARLLWKHDLEGEPAPPRLADGVLYVGTDTEVLYALRVGPAAPRGSAVPSRSVVSAPVPTRLPQRTPGPPPTTRRDHQTTGPAKKKPSKSSRPPKVTSSPPTSDPITTPTEPPATTADEPGDGG
jgi:outer membrane protein assembly factor BamB